MQLRPKTHRLEKRVDHSLLLRTELFALAQGRDVLVDALSGALAGDGIAKVSAENLEHRSAGAILLELWHDHLRKQGVGFGVKVTPG